jgi:virulence-associated protein VagC
MLKDIGRFVFPSKGKTGILYIPAKITNDSQFPLTEGQVEITAEGDHLIIRDVTPNTLISQAIESVQNKAKIASKIKI